MAVLTTHLFAVSPVRRDLFALANEPTGNLALCLSTPGIMITGTDTEVGKTFVSVQLLKAAALAGKRSAGLKPIASGCTVDAHGALVSEDACALRAVSTVALSNEESNRYAFLPPISPHLAARAAGVSIDIHEITRAANAVRARCDFLLIEGAGGWLTPLGADVEHSDIAKALDLAVVLVVPLRLGCINHARLSAAGISHSGARLLGWVANFLGHARSADTCAMRDAVGAYLDAPMLAEF
jgi:dethiobiotin synthetase